MSATSSQARRLESAISICLIAILFLIAGAVFIKQFNYNMSRFGIDTTAAPRFEIPFELSSLVPAGFETFSEIETYNSENLYEKINGKAPLYIESGFEKLSTQRFISKDDESLWTELFVYDMGAIKNAFSVYSVQVRAEAEILPDMRFAYRTSNALFFVHGKYYVELVGSSESSELFNAMAAIAQQIRSDFAVDKVTQIAELSLFPSENIVPGSAKLYLANAFGFEELTDTFTVKYNIDGETITAFLSKRPNPKDAKKVAENYYDFLIDNGGVVKRPANETLRAIEGKVIDFYGTIEIVFAVGPFVAGIHEAENRQAAEKLAEILINRLNEAVSVNGDRTKQ